MLIIDSGTKIWRQVHLPRHIILSFNLKTWPFFAIGDVTDMAELGSNQVLWQVNSFVFEE